MYRTRILVASLLVALGVPFFSSAATVAELQAQLAALQQQVTALISRQNAAALSSSNGLASCPNLLRNLSRSSRGEDVTQLQQFLISQNLLAADSATGFFGSLTERAVQQWQAINGIVSSGSPSTTGYGAVGPKTRAALVRCSTSATRPQNPVTTPGGVSVPIPSGGGGSGGGGTPTQPPHNPSAPTYTPTQGGGTSSSPSPQSCPFASSTAAHGASVTAYQSATVASGQTCASQTRTCTNGSLSGSYSYASCSIGSAQTCSFNNQSVAHGSSVTAYQSATVAYGQTCASQTRTCSNGFLSGSYAHSSCSVGGVTNQSCLTYDNTTVAHGVSRPLYFQQNVAAGQSCSTVEQTRTCTNGQFSGESNYRFANCVPFAEKISFTHGITGSFPVEIVIDSAQNVYTANLGSRNVSKITLAGESTTMGATDDSPRALTVDKNGNVYVANRVANNILKITPDGTQSIFANIGSHSLGIIIDEQGNLYTTSYDESNVRRITPTGQVTILGSTGLNPIGIVIDKQGNIYTANHTGNSVTKITQTGIATTHGQTGSTPREITIDSNGNVYTANHAGNTVTKITPSGESTTYGTTGLNPLGIAVDLDGNVYTANYNSHNVTRISSQGVTSVYGLTGTNPRGVVFGPDRTLYIANWGSNSVTRIPIGTVTNQSCLTYDNTTVVHGSSRELYSQQNVPPGASCTSVAQTRMCSNGTFSGDATFRFANCTTLPPVNCVTYDGTTVVDGTYRELYSQQNVAAGASCSSVAQIRACNNGAFSGDAQYRFANCTPLPANCVTYDNTTIPHGSAQLLFSQQNVASEALCSSVSQTRMCTNGTLSGDATYRFANCTPL